MSEFEKTQYGKANKQIKCSTLGEQRKAFHFNEEIKECRNSNKLMLCNLTQLIEIQRIGMMIMKIRAAKTNVKTMKKKKINLERHAWYIKEQFHANLVLQKAKKNHQKSKQEFFLS